MGDVANRMAVEFLDKLAQSVKGQKKVKDKESEAKDTKQDKSKNK